MYKTIRHGENSLQYTILPQNDDFRIDGKITGSGNTCGHKSKRGRRRSFFAYLGLLFVCTVIVGAILVPFLVSAECLPNPSDWFLRTRVALLDAGKMSSIDKQDNKTESTIKAYPNTNHILKTTEQSTTVKSEESVTLDNIFTIPILSDKKEVSDTTNKIVVRTEGNVVMDHVVTEIPAASIVLDVKTITEVPTITPKIAQNLKEDVKIVKQIEEIVVTPTTTSTISTTSTTSTTTTVVAAPVTTSIFRTQITTSKKPIILPVLAKTNSIVRENGRAIDKNEGAKNWIKLHWPPVYFQLDGYKTAIILPAILGLTLIGIVLVTTICLVSRNKKTIVATMKKRNPNDIESAGEDNTTLLTTGNLSDDD